MSHKQWSAVVMIAVQLAVVAWVVYDRSANPEQYGTLRDVAVQLAWAIGYAIVLNIITIIVVVILVSIARGEELKDERADERDRAIAARSLRNAYFVLSVGGLAALLTIAFAYSPIAALYVLFAAMALAALTDSVSQLVYYGRG